MILYSTHRKMIERGQPVFVVTWPAWVMPQGTICNDPGFVLPEADRACPSVMELFATKAGATKHMADSFRAPGQPAPVLTIEPAGAFDPLSGSRLVTP